MIATNREESMKRWLPAWREQLGKDVELVIVQDTPELSDMDLDAELAGYPNVKRYAWSSIDTDLGEYSWVIPRRTSAIKSYGFLKATGDIIWTLDDDCFPETYPLGYTWAIERTLSGLRSNSPWFNTMHDDAGLYPRGYPYEKVREYSPVKVWHGLWSGIPDLDGITALEHPDFRTAQVRGTETVPHGKLFPMCGMNLAFTRDMLPAMYFMLQGHMMRGGELTKLPFDRFDDIWAGLFAKRVLDNFGWTAVSGGPSIRHTKESDPQMRVEKEAPGITAHESLWKMVANRPVEGTDVVRAYRSLIPALHAMAGRDPYYGQYFNRLADAMYLWTEFF